MNFTEYLNNLYTKLDCSQTELCKASNLSASVISRYLSGDRAPAVNSEQVISLANGIHAIAISHNLKGSEFETENLVSRFNESIEKKNVEYKAFLRNFNLLVETLDINLRELSISLNYDSSYLYRVRSGERRPTDYNNFCESLSEFIAKHYCDENVQNVLAELLNCDIHEIGSYEKCREKIKAFLIESSIEDDIPEMSNFLDKMNDFNLDEYIKVIHFDEMKIPNVPFKLPIKKNYYGVEEMRKAEIDFLKATVLGKSMEPVFMCSFMPMEQMADDMDFNKKWMFGIAMMIKKGLHLNVIHNLNRPMSELMLGFEAWIPIYMTGQVSPYHIPDYDNHIFHQINYCSGSAALMGECIEDYYSEGKYYVSTNKQDIRYYRNKTNAILKHAKPLMDIYSENEKKKFDSFFKKSVTVKGERHFINSMLPIFTLPEKLLLKYTDKCDGSAKNKILEYRKETYEYIREIMKKNNVIYDVCRMSEEEFNKNPIVMSFPNLFLDCEITLSYEDYKRHLEATIDFANENSNFNINYVEVIPFNNIRICVVSGKYFVISKCKNPNLHFVIHHPKMLQGMENFKLARNEDA